MDTDGKWVFTFPIVGLLPPDCTYGGDNCFGGPGAILNQLAGYMLCTRTVTPGSFSQFTK